MISPVRLAGGELAARMAYIVRAGLVTGHLRWWRSPS
jgi:hypothetical protein